DLIGWKRAGGSVPDLLDHITVQHHRNVGTTAAPRLEKDGVSVIGFKSYDQGPAKWQGDTLDFGWFYDEPPFAPYTAGLTPTNASGGIGWITMTPLQGIPPLMQSFLDECGGIPD